MMPDREKVIDGLEKHITTIEASGDGHKWRFVQVEIIEAALELLKAQEPVEPIRQWDDDETTWWYSCGSCVQAVDYKDKYCRLCGKGLKWDAVD